MCMQVVAFLVKLLQLSAIRPLSSSATRTMNALYHLDDSRNAEICAVWYRLCMSAGIDSLQIMHVQMWHPKTDASAFGGSKIIVRRHPYYPTVWPYLLTFSVHWSSRKRKPTNVGLLVFFNRRLSSCLLCTGDKAVLPLIISFLKEQGRMKYLRPLYQALAKSSEDIALQTYSEACKSYHPIAAKMVASDLHINKN